jgi:hypothetical protein
MLKEKKRTKPKNYYGFVALKLYHLDQLLLIKQWLYTNGSEMPKKLISTIQWRKNNFINFIIVQGKGSYSLSPNS